MLLSELSAVEVSRGQIVCSPGTEAPQQTFEAAVYVLEENEGGQSKGLTGDQNAQFFFRTIDITGSISWHGDDARIPAGRYSHMTVNLLVPVAMRLGLRFAIRAGGRTIGAGIVTKIL